MQDTPAAPDSAASPAAATPAPAAPAAASTPAAIDAIAHPPGFAARRLIVFAGILLG